MASRKGQESFSVKVFYLKEEKKYLFLYSVRRCLGHGYSRVSKTAEGNLSDLLTGLKSELNLIDSETYVEDKFLPYYLGKYEGPDNLLESWTEERLEILTINSTAHVLYAEKLSREEEERKQKIMAEARLEAEKEFV